MTTAPTHDQLAPSINPTERMYIEAYVAAKIAEATTPLLHDLNSAFAAISDLSTRLTEAEAKLNTMAAKVDQRFVSKRGAA